MIEPRYKGELSEAFWQLVHLVDDDNYTLYDLGCKLQTLEGEVLKKLQQRCIYIQQLKRPPKRKRKKAVCPIR
ncbi:MAG: hypothetical protein ACYS30_19665 [Planctomycetota bacterium]|jgi:hypothetical protein